MIITSRKPIFPYRHLYEKDAYINDEIEKLIFGCSALFERRDVIIVASLGNLWVGLTRYREQAALRTGREKQGMRLSGSWLPFSMSAMI